MANRIRYWHPNLANSRITIAYDLDTNLFGVAWCNPEDQFNKKLGRIIALGRLEKKPFLSTAGDDPPAKRLQAALSQAISSDRIPKWYREELEKQKGASGALGAEHWVREKK